ncbi:ciliary-associated calcium-binding coiled-coil protein 1 isoform X1 [Suricata suricatta]|uniref:ciliary-associated calcium-binding coiled-coil protein 1 isoform X1 n=1 Tax=Suricata suricatta TaxID=37032 RepID=UPI001155F764|nr:ciliary-associated calcium-binding coiled-coil protein 1 isoform X1 [Suricata suricatta]
MTTTLGTTPGGTTPAATAPAGTTHELERDAEFQEHEKILSPDFLSVAQITEMLTEDVDGVQQKLKKFLNFKNLQTCLKEAILLDYYVSGFLWARGMDFSVIQYSKFMTLLDTLLHNLRTLHMSLENSIKWLGEVMTEIGPSHSQKTEEGSIFNIKQSNAVIDYLKISLFQHYKLYEFLFYSTRDEIVIGTESLHVELHSLHGAHYMDPTNEICRKEGEAASLFEQMIEVVKPSSGLFPDPLEEGISLDIYSTFIEPPPTLDLGMKGLDQEQVPEESHTEAISDMDPLMGFTIEDITSVLGQVTDDILISLQTEINEKLQIQEEAFNARIEKLKKA